VDAWSYIRLGLCLLVASTAMGCGLPRGFRSNPGYRSGANQAVVSSTDYSYAAAMPPPDAIPGGTVIAAGGVGSRELPTNSQVPQNAIGDGMMPQPMLPPSPPPATLPQPRPLPSTPNWPKNAQPPQPGQPQPGTPGYMMGSPTQFADPHLRANPTVTGDRLGLAPWEVPADRVLALTKQLDSLVAQNAALSARIKELEGLGLGREQALLEAMREVETTTAAASKERTALQGQIAGLQGRIKQLEEEDIVFLRAVIDALNKLLPPPPPERKP